MGSSGSGRFTDFPGASKKEKSGDGGSGGPGGQDRCSKAFSVKLEDIEHFDYFKKHGHAPAIGTILQIAQKKRIVAETASGEVVGALPTSFNYLAECLHSGYTYVGQVRDSSNGPPAATTAVDFAPT